MLLVDGTLLCHSALIHLFMYAYCSFSVPPLVSFLWVEQKWYGVELEVGVIDEAEKKGVQAIGGCGSHREQRRKRISVGGGLMWQARRRRRHVGVVCWLLDTRRGPVIMARSEFIKESAQEYLRIWLTSVLMVSRWLHLKYA